MDLQLVKKIALVSGSTAGIGFAIAEALAKEGVTVYINGRTQERVQQAIDKIQKTGAKGVLKPAVFDFGTKEGITAFAKTVDEVDILINNLGYYEPKNFEDISDEDWLKIFEVNVMSGVRLSRTYFPKMIKKNWGRIIFISSESAVQIPTEMIHYGLTKTAQLSLARGLAELTKGKAVTVNSILVGPTRSEGVEEFIEQLSKSQHVDPKTVEKEFFEKTRPTSLLKRFATAEEVANLVAFISSPLSSAINGAAIRAEGGVLRSII